MFWPSGLNTGLKTGFVLFTMDYSSISMCVYIVYIAVEILYERGVLCEFHIAVCKVNTVCNEYVR